MHSLHASIIGVPTWNLRPTPLYRHPSSASIKSPRHPMGSCFSKTTTDDPPPLATRDVISQERSSLVRPQTVGAPRYSSQQQSSTTLGRDPSQVRGVPSYKQRPTRDRVQSTPHKTKNDLELSPLPRQRTRAKSFVTPSSSRGPSLDQRQKQMSAGEYSHHRARVSY